MDPKTMQRMRKHIADSEGTLPNPYKDTKGKLTVGTGFLVDDEKSFVAMPFEIEDPKTGEPRPATEAEKKTEFKRAKGLPNDQRGGQKTAVIDIHYANGDLGKFPKLKEAIRNGDAKAMAESRTSTAAR